MSPTILIAGATGNIGWQLQPRFAMAFSLGVELLNMRFRKKSTDRVGAVKGAA